MQDDSSSQKSGFAVFVGRSNVGKSTLLNNLIGSKVAITTPKPQTTRHAIHGIFTDERGQIVFVDTPGVLKKKDVLTKQLLQVLRQSLKDIDVVIYTVDATRDVGEEEKMVWRYLKHLTVPRILCINKIDRANPELLDVYRDMGADFDHVVEVSALRGTNLEHLRQTIFDVLPEGELFYPPGQVTNHSSEFLAAEIIREKLFLRLRQEVPYGAHVEVDQMEVRENEMLYIEARIFVTTDRFKPIIIGKGGRGLKEIGQAARKDLETITGRKVFLQLNVEVNPRWTQTLIQD